MTIFFKSKNEVQNETHQNILNKYHENLKQPQLIHLGNFELTHNGEQPPIYKPCDTDCQKCQNNEYDYENVICIPVRWASNYSHFILEVLPKILRLQKHHSAIPILMYTTTPIINAINYFGIKNPIISIGSFSSHTEIKHIGNSSMYEDYFDHKTTPEDLNFVRSHVDIPENGDLCVIIRRREASRSIVNFEKMYKVLRNNFPNENWVVFETQPFGEMIKIFSRAKLIICPHGAGTANALFSPSNVSILEVYPSEWIRSSFIHFTQALGMTHYLFSADINYFKVDIEEILQSTFNILNSVK